MDLREFGRRRESTCNSFRDQAIKIALENGTLVEAGEDNATIYHILGLLVGSEFGLSTGVVAMLMQTIHGEEANSKLSRPYASAFGTHVRSLVDADELRSRNRKFGVLKWSFILVRPLLSFTI